MTRAGTYTTTATPPPAYALAGHAYAPDRQTRTRITPEPKSGAGVQDYGFRIYDPGIIRFWSTDPLTSDYPWYSPYQFAGNKPIWATDVDGLEELIYQYTLENGGATLLQVVDNREIQTRMVFDPSTGVRRNERIVLDKRTGKPFAPEEVGMVQYQYYTPDGERMHVRRDYTGEFVDGDNELMSPGTDNLFGSIYIGPNNPTRVVVATDGQQEVLDDYRREPQDEADAAALQHDKNYGRVGAVGVNGAFLNRDAIPADDVLLQNAEETLNKSRTGGTDDITGEPVSRRTGLRALAIWNFFRTVRDEFKPGPAPSLDQERQPQNAADLSRQRAAQQ